jgi:hypothetical protein
LKVNKDLQRTRILAVGVTSKHARGKKWKPEDEINKKTETSEYIFDPKSFTLYYKVFIQDIPDNMLSIEETQNKDKIDNPCKRVKRNT